MVLSPTTRSGDTSRTPLSFCIGSISNTDCERYFGHKIEPHYLHLLDPTKENFGLDYLVGQCVGVDRFSAQSIADSGPAEEEEVVCTTKGKHIDNLSDSEDEDEINTTPALVRYN